MSISNEITRLQTAKANIKTSIENKGVTVPSATKLDGYPTLIDSIPSGGSAVIEPLSVTANGTYTAPTGVDGYSPVSVNVSGGGGGVSPKQINFFDYDGTCLHSFTASEWANETALPSNPSHTGLTAQGWNWTKAEIDAQLVSTPEQDINVGQVYKTASGATEIDINLDDPVRLSPYIPIGVNGNVEIDWGDGSTTTVTGTSISTLKNTGHIYASTGNYTIKIRSVSGTYKFVTSQGNYILNSNSSSVNTNRCYPSCVQAVRIGQGDASMISNDYCFAECHNMKSITISNSITTIGASAFRNCCSLLSIIIPRGVSQINSYAAQYCCSMKSFSIPRSITSIKDYVFQYCYALMSITINNNITSIGRNCIQNCYALLSVTIHGGLTSIGSNNFSNCYSLKSVTILSGVTTIGSSNFVAAYSLSSVTIPSSVTNLGGSAFSNCYCAIEYHIKPTNPPTFAAGVFSNIPSDCIIYVPAESLEAYQTASGWSTHASKMQGE